MFYQEEPNKKSIVKLLSLHIAQEPHGSVIFPDQEVMMGPTV